MVIHGNQSAIKFPHLKNTWMLWWIHWNVPPSITTGHLMQLETVLYVQRGKISTMVQVPACELINVNTEAVVSAAAILNVWCKASLLWQHGNIDNVPSCFSAHHRNVQLFPQISCMGSWVQHSLQYINIYWQCNLPCSHLSKRIHHSVVPCYLLCVHHKGMPYHTILIPSVLCLSF